MQLGSLTGDQRPYSDQIQTLKSYFVHPVALLAANSPRRRFSVFTISNKSFSMSNKLLSMSSKSFSMLEVLNIFYYNHSVYVYETCPASHVLQGLWWSVLGLPKLLSLSHGWYNTCMIKNQNISQRCWCTICIYKIIIGTFVQFLRGTSDSILVVKVSHRWRDPSNTWYCHS